MIGLPLGKATVGDKLSVGVRVGLAIGATKKGFPTDLAVGVTAGEPDGIEIYGGDPDIGSADANAVAIGALPD